ncbi:MAG: heavy-metal-associated domain-containing protein [Bacteroidales bacterium]|nr:heavy-metal-associated domain-containing protein [Bacteroidales bacterium]
MKKIIVALILAFSALSLTAAPVLPAKVATVQKQDKKKKVQTVTFKTSIHCKNSVKKINDNIPFEKGVKDLKVSLDEKLVTITYDPSKTNEEQLAKALEKLGYTAQKQES